MSTRPRLLFISPQFLFPLDAGGKIRTTNILKHMKGGAFEIELISPAKAGEAETWVDEISSICDTFAPWPNQASRLSKRLWRLLGGLSHQPVAVWSDRSRAGRRAVLEALKRKPDLVVTDFTHGAILCPDDLGVPSVLFTHNVETEIFKRHAELNSGLLKFAWQLEHIKMRRFEHAASQRFSTVITVSDRDADFFSDTFGVKNAKPIPTGVDLKYFAYQSPPNTGNPLVTFTGSMDWRANIDGIEWFMNEVWPKIISSVPDATFRIIGRNPPDALQLQAQKRGLAWTFTGFVDDVRTHMDGAQVYVIPLRVGGGTRIKAFEAMASGTPIVSTAMGMEGLPAENGTHFLEANSADDFAKSVIKVLTTESLRTSTSKNARQLVEERFGVEKVAEVFEAICLETLDQE